MFDRFERIFVINLPNRIDRRRETGKELLRVGGSRAEFYSAIRPLNAGKFGSIGEHGCFMSHLTLLKNCIECKNILLMEDDVHFTVDFAERSTMLDGLPDDWEIFYGGHGQLPGVRRTWTETGLVEVDVTIEFIGTHCYAVNGPAIQKLIQAYETFLSRERGHPDGGPMPADGALNIARRQLHLRTFAAIPPLAHQRSSRTDVGEPRWIDNAPLLNSAVQLARRLKNKLQRLAEARHSRSAG
jgi:glycosyl transferase family 25